MTTVNVNSYMIAGETTSEGMFQRAIDAVYSGGGGTVEWDSVHVINGNVTVKAGVWLKGPLGMPGEILASIPDYDTKQGTLKLVSTATITLNDDAQVTNCVIMRNGLDLPFADASSAAAGVSAFAGTALTIYGQDASLANLLILGFNLAISSSNSERIRCENVFGDCTNGMSINSCYDIAYIRTCHFWPFTTAHQSWTTNALCTRSGTAYTFTGVSDWTKVSDCFSFGYFRGFVATDVSSMTFLNCGADQVSVNHSGDYANSIGFVVNGNSDDIRLIGCQSAAQTHGYYIDAPAGSHTRLLGCDTWSDTNSGVVVSGGDVNIEGGLIKDLVHGVNIVNASSRVFVDGVRFKGLSGKHFLFSVANPNVIIGNNNDYADLPAGSTPIGNPSNWTNVVIPAGDPLNLPANGNQFSVSGSAGFGTLQGGWKGREVTLFFSGNPTLWASIGTTNSMKLANGASFNATPGSSIKLAHNGVQWNEVSRLV